MLFIGAAWYAMLSGVVCLRTIAMPLCVCRSVSLRVGCHAESPHVARAELATCTHADHAPCYSRLEIWLHYIAAVLLCWWEPCHIWTVPLHAGENQQQSCSDCGCVALGCVMAKSFFNKTKCSLCRQRIVWKRAGHCVHMRYATIAWHPLHIHPMQQAAACNQHTAGLWQTTPQQHALPPQIDKNSA